MAPEPLLFSAKELTLLRVIEMLYQRNRKRLVIKKQDRPQLSVLDIQSYLTSIYHFYKWFLVEVLEY